MTSVESQIAVYFCDPRSPFQRGSNENMKGLRRQHLPKGMDLSGVSESTQNTVAQKLNERPRKPLAWSTPAKVLLKTVAMNT